MYREDFSANHILVLVRLFHNQLWRWNTSSSCNQWTKNKVVFFLCYTCPGMNFQSREKQILKSFGFTKVCKDLKWTKTSWIEVMQPITIHDQFFLTISASRQILRIPLLKEDIIYFGISKLRFTFEIFSWVQGSVLIKSARKANIWLHTHYCS